MKKENIFIFIGLLIISFLYISDNKFSFTQSTVEQCISHENPTLSGLINQTETLGNFSIIELANCDNQVLGGPYKTLKDKEIYIEYIPNEIFIINETTNQTQSATLQVPNYKWCVDNDLYVRTEKTNEVNNYFNNLFTCTDIEKCAASSECLSNETCSNNSCIFLNCNATLKQVPMSHQCTVLDCTSNSTCVKEADTDCDGEVEEVNGGCAQNKCSYMDFKECSKAKLFYNKHKLWIVIGMALIIIGIGIIVMKK